MKILNVIVLSLLIIGCSTMKTADSPKESTHIDQKKEIEAILNELFTNLKSADTLALNKIFDNDITLGTIYGQKLDNRIQTRFVKTSKKEFYKNLEKSKELNWDEKLLQIEVQQDVYMANAWVPYSFYVNDSLSHCGNNSFMFRKTAEGWKIFYIADTRIVEGCNK